MTIIMIMEVMKWWWRINDSNDVNNESNGKE